VSYEASTRLDEALLETGEWVERDRIESLSSKSWGRSVVSVGLHVEKPSSMAADQG
jgi:hypothetical protein